MPKKYIAPIKYLGGAIISILIFGLVIFDPLTEQFLSAETRDSVLVSAIPFVAVFVSIILAFILLIFMVALRFNGKIPRRTYRPVEKVIIAGIIGGIACLFQPWQIVSYNYGFTLLLGSTLGFILWSHVNPRSNKDATGIAPFSNTHQIIGAVVGLVILVGMMAVLVPSATPAEPYGYSQRQWDRGLRDEQKEEIKEAAENTFRTFTLPFLVFFSAFPAAAGFFISREVAATFGNDDSGRAAQAIQASTSG